MITNKKAPAVTMSVSSASTSCGRAILVATMVALFAATACAPRVDTRGNAVLIDDVAKLEPGTHTRDHVLNALGSPSSSATFGNDVWYYISERTETTAFFAPEVIERQVVVIKFDEHSVIQTVDVLDEQNAENVEPTDRTTPTAGNTLGMIEQLLSNIGRFNKK
jgi:outer membrane protein assembly factor BamE (lipoprotein component of BamABCDE complex)